MTYPERIQHSLCFTSEIVYLIQAYDNKITNWRLFTRYGFIYLNDCRKSTHFHLNILEGLAYLIMFNQYRFVMFRTNLIYKL